MHLHAAARRGRTALLCGVIAFVTLQLGLTIAIELWLPEFRDPYYGYKVNRLRHRLAQFSSSSALAGATWPPSPSDHPQPFRPRLVLMLGSSRTVNALKAKELEAQLAREAGVPVWAFNFGTLGAGPLTELLNLKRLLREGIHPDLLLVEVFPAVLAAQESVAHAELYRFPVTRLWHRELALMRSYGYPAPELRHDWWEGCLVPWYTQRFCIVSWAAPATLPWNLRQDWFREVDDSGWVNPPQLQREAGQYEQAVARAHAEYAPYFSGFRLGGPPCRALRELLDLCRREHVATALVLMPEGSPFRSWYPADALKATDRFLRQLRQEYGIAVIDARQWIPDEDFVDSHHLLPEGAALFTERLGRTALLPLLSPSALGMHGGTQVQGERLGR